MPKNPEEKWPSEAADTIDWEQFQSIPGLADWAEEQVKETKETIDWLLFRVPVLEPWDEVAKTDIGEKINWQSFGKSVISQNSEVEDT